MTQWSNYTFESAEFPYFGRTLEMAKYVQNSLKIGQNQSN